MPSPTQILWNGLIGSLEDTQFTLHVDLLWWIRR